MRTAFYITQLKLRWESIKNLYNLPLHFKWPIIIKHTLKFSDTPYNAEYPNNTQKVDYVDIILNSLSHVLDKPTPLQCHCPISDMLVYLLLTAVAPHLSSWL